MGSPIYQLNPSARSVDRLTNKQQPRQLSSINTGNHVLKCLNFEILEASVFG